MPERDWVIMDNVNKEKLAALERRLEAYYKAEEKILKSQSFSIGSNQVTRTSLANVQAKIKELENEVAALKGRGTSKRRSARVIRLG